MKNKKYIVIKKQDNVWVLFYEISDNIPIYVDDLSLAKMFDTKEEAEAILKYDKSAKVAVYEMEIR